MATEFPTTHPTGKVTLVFTDIEGSSELSEQHGATFEAARREHFRLLREVTARCSGYEVETAGDALFLVFEHASDAVQFAVEAQRAIAAHTWPPQIGELRVRIGMHTGEPFIGEDNGRPIYRGPATNRAARVQSAAHGGQILLSGTAAEAAQAGALPETITLRDCGEHRLKGVGEMHLWQVCHPALPSEFPPLNTLNPQRHNLPAPTTLLIGRENEVAALRDLLEKPSTRLLTLVGFGGLGKTRLALQMAELCVQGFADGVWWVGLDERRSAEGMVGNIALALRLRPQPETPIKEQLLHFLSGRHLLLVLDNTEQITDAPRVIDDLLKAAPRLQILVTSRRALGLSNERLHEVAPLPPGDATRLFVERACARRHDFALDENNAADIEEICRRLEGVPLALELAASRIASLAPRDILRHLDQRFKVLQTRAPDLPPRQRALRGAIDWSYELLTEDDQSLFAQLAVFARGFTLDDAEAICDALDVFEGVQELRGQSLLRVETDAATHQARFLMLEAVREYAAEKLAATPELDSMVRKRHAEYFQGFAAARIAQLRTPQETQALQELETHLDNVRAALEWAMRSAQAILCARLALELGIFLQRRGLIHDAARRLGIGLQTAPQLVEECPELVAQLWRERAGLSLDMMEPETAQNSAEEALALFTRLGDAKGQAEATNLLGLAAKRAGNWDEARRCFGTALTLYGEAEDEIGVAIVQTNLGATECEDAAGDREAAARHLQSALEVRRRYGDRRGVAEALNNLGVLAQEQGQLNEAARYYKDALLCEQQLENTIGVARVLYNLSEIAESRADWPRALYAAVASAHLFDEIGSPLLRYASVLCTRVAAHSHKDEAALRVQIKDKSLDEIIVWALKTATS